MTIENQGEKLFGVKRGVSKILSDNADVPFIDRINNYQDYPMPASNKDGRVSTHLLSAEIDDDGIAWVFPNKVLDKTNNTYTTYDDNFEAMAVAKASGNAVRFNTIQEAELFSKSYKNDDFNKYYNPSEKERGKTFEGSGANIVDTAKQAYKSTLNVIEESTIPLFGKDSLGTNTLGKIADAVPLVKSVLSPEDSVEKRREEIEKLSQSISDRTPDNLTLTQQGFRAALESAPLTAVAMVASIFGTPATGLSIMGGYTGALEYNEAREKGKTFAQSLTYGTVQGSIEAFTERLGLKPLMRMFKNKGDGFMQDAVAYGTRELIGENAAEFGQSMTAWYAGLDEALMNPDLSKTDKLILQAQRQYVASVAALSMSGTTTATTASVKELASQLEDNNAPKRSEGWVKTRATYTRKDKDGNDIEKETGADVYTRIVRVNGEIVPAEEVERTKNVKEDNTEKAPAWKDGMYSKLQEAIMNMRLEINKPQDVMNYFKNKAVVWDEMRDSGMLTFLQDSIKEGKPVTRTELMKQFNDFSLIKSYRRETLFPSSVKATSVFDLIPESDIIAINEYGLEDEANRDRANGRALNQQEIKDRIEEESKFMYSIVVRGALDNMRVDEDGITIANDNRTRSPELSTDNITTNYSKKEIEDLVMNATIKANQDLVTNPTSVDDVNTSKEEGKKALNKLVVFAKRTGFVTYEDIVEILPEDYLDTEQVEGIVKVLEEMNIAIADKDDFPKKDYPLLKKKKESQIKYIEKYLPEDLKNDLDSYTKELAKKYSEENPEYTWNVNTPEYSYNVIGYDGAYTLTITANAYGEAPAKTMLVEEIDGPLSEVEVRMKRYDQSNAIDPVITGTGKNARWDKQTYNSPSLDPKTYKETLIIMDGPEGGELKGGYPYTHYSGINNTVLHLRTSERIDDRGKKILYIEEMQSDWLEAGERVITSKTSANYGMPEFGWRDSEKHRKALVEISDKNAEYSATAKELITIFRKNLRRQFPEKNQDGTIFNEEIRSQDSYATDLGGKAFKDLRNKFYDEGYQEEYSLLKSIYFSELDNLDDLVDTFSEAYDDVTNDIPYSNLGNIGGDNAEALSSFHKFFKAFKTVTNSKDFYYDKNLSTYENDLAMYDRNDSPFWLGFLSKEQYRKLRNESDKQEDTRKEFKKVSESVPKMPMKEKWHEFGMRVAVNMAIEGGFDRVAWANSDEQVRRWNKGSTESARYNESAGKVIITPVPEGVNKKMFVSLYDKKLPSYAQRLANQYNSKSGKTIIDFDERWSPEERKRLAADTKSELIAAQKNSYLDISPEMVEAFKSGRVKFYRRGGLVSKANPEWLENAGRSIAQSMRNKKWAEYLLELESQKDKKISPGWQGYRRRYAEGGEVTNPIDGLRDYILSEIDGMKFNFAGKLAKGSIIKAVNKSFADLGTNPSREQVENLWLEQSANLDNLNKILKNPENQEGIKQRITDTYNKAYDSQFNLDIPTTEATKLAETGAVAAGGGVLRPLLSSGTQRLAPLLSAVVPGTAQAPTTTEMYGVEFGTPEYYSAGVSFGDSLLSNKKDRREDRVNRTSKIEELKAKNAQAVAEAKARDEQKEEVSVPSSGPSTRGTRAGRTRPSSPPPRVSSGPTRRGSRRGRKRPTRRLTPGR